MDYDLGYVDLKTRALEPIGIEPFGGIDNTQVIEKLASQKRQNSQISGGWSRVGHVGFAVTSLPSSFASWPSV
jgi:hypothetical protein